MEPINPAVLESFIGAWVTISIYDEQGSDQAPSLQKNIKKIQLCPDQTHIRIYFDDFYFLAVPRTSEMKQTELHWSAYDSESGLHYTVTKAQGF